jgi:hypothetical protein
MSGLKAGAGQLSDDELKKELVRRQVTHEEFCIVCSAEEILIYVSIAIV